MTMALPRTSTCSTRPAYLDNLFRDSSPSVGTPSLHSATSSISFRLSGSSTSTYESRSSQPQLYSRPLSPALEEDQSDMVSVRSLRLNLSPRFRMRNIFNRHTHPQAKQADEIPPLPAPLSRSASLIRSASRRPSLPKIQTTFTPPPRKSSMPAEKRLPKAPTPTAQELSCHRCYYYAARNCKGWVMGGGHGDACEQCLQVGFFGAP